MYDTRLEYKSELVSYGIKVKTYTVTGNYKDLSFPANKLGGTVRIDERNLGSCKWLNLKASSVASLDGTHLKSLEVLLATDS